MALAGSIAEIVLPDHIDYKLPQESPLRFVAL
jgi:hypothetical protein